ncbi:MAG: radical SAM protein, partial [Rhodothermia bacterium]|nr:radical SAM protein [Rhodothermia bacterium]
SDAGATRANYIVVRLPGPVRPLFLEWLRREFPERADRVVGRIRELRAGGLTDPRFKTRHTGEGEWAEVLRKLFSLSLNKYGLTASRTHLSTKHFRRVRERQLGLF